ncbi:hypothetical protein Patl1_11538 [Pistacia atlantica]|uniref:Uncharacterized protein n=1 Tax=Pistacia atlantica TaxID=434234 RepID=A0ACC1A6K3_9ROSI|nr:hypothetical protein Patl1_11538 [Pistacia atlantica]
MPFGIIHRCYFSFPTLLRRRLNPVCSRQAHVPDNKVELTEKVSGIDSNLKVEKVKQKLELVRIICNDSCIPGQYHRLFCPQCKGGQSMERSLYLHIIQDGTSAFDYQKNKLKALNLTFQAFADSNNNRKVLSSKQMTEKSLGLEPLGDKAFMSCLIAYFAERMISERTLQRNSVMQLSGDQAVIAFPFRQNGVLVGCKYQTYREKFFWQERGTEKWLFGLDDIKEAAEIIIVEGEMDKLAMEAAGFLNCVSVPCGAPQKASARELPPREKDTGYQYIWNCKEPLDKVSRIILATDGDVPGQALAEELARHLGKERFQL